MEAIRIGSEDNPPLPCLRIVDRNAVRTTPRSSTASPSQRRQPFETSERFPAPFPWRGLPLLTHLLTLTRRARQVTAPIEPAWPRGRPRSHGSMRKEMRHVA
jgi:hypothetical protein